MELLINNNTSTSFSHLYIKLKFYKNGKVIALDSTIISDIDANSEKIAVVSFHHLPSEFDNYDISFSRND